jgi:hypothetical protein
MPMERTKAGRNRSVGRVSYGPVVESTYLESSLTRRQTTDVCLALSRKCWYGVGHACVTQKQNISVPTMMARSSYRIGTSATAAAAAAATAAVSTVLIGGSLLCCVNLINSSEAKEDGNHEANFLGSSNVNDIKSWCQRRPAIGNETTHESRNILLRSLQIHNNSRSISISNSNNNSNSNSSIKNLYSSLYSDDQYNTTKSNHNNIPSDSSSFLKILLASPPFFRFPPVTTTFCEASAKNHNKNNNHNSSMEDDGYPNFKRHGKHAYLPKYLTRDIYHQLRHRQTTSGVTLNDIIATGVSLPLGALPPRGFGIFAGDAESYRVFAPLFIPLLEDHHGIQLSKPSSTTNTASATSSTASTVHVPALEQFLYQRSDASAASSTTKITTTTTTTTAPRPPTVVASKHTRSLSSSHDNGAATNPSTTTSSTPPSSQLSRLKRQVTNLNPEFVLSQSLDPSGQYILYTRMRLSRSIEGFAFSPTISREKRRELERLLQSCMDDWKPNKGDGWKSSEDSGSSSSTSITSTASTNNFDGMDDDDDDDDDTGSRTTTPSRNKEWLALSAHGKYSSILDMSNADHDDLIQRHVLFEDPDDYSIAAGIGRDWPDARGVYYDKWDSPEVMIWYNAEDHVRIISLRKGGDLLGVFTRLSLAVSALQTSLKQRGYSFAMDPQLGFLNTSPANVGTALRASVFVKLVRLGQQPGFRDLIHRLRLEATTRYDDSDSARTRTTTATTTTATLTHKQRYTGIFDIANAERLGKSEVQLINTMIHGVGRLIELEKRLERGEKVDLSQIQK